MRLKHPFSELTGWLIDMDGVVYRGSVPTPGAADFVRALQQGGHRFMFLTNNATKTPRQYVDKLAAMDIHVGDDNVFTSPLATTAYLVRHMPPPRRVLVVGGDGIQSAIADAGYTVVLQAEAAEIVVSGLDQHITYEHLAEAALAIEAGATWIATNPDRNVPSERGRMPGAGALLAFLEASTDCKPIIIGKPATGIYEQALALLGTTTGNTVMLGDRLETDILGGHNAGLRTICVLTGIASPAAAAEYVPRPDWIVPDLTHVLEGGNG